MKIYSRICLLTALAIGVGTASAQSLFPEQQRIIEMNNPGLHALTVAAEASSTDALTSLSLPNPEVSVAHLFAVNKGEPDETEIEVSQGFDFATLSGAKRQVAQAQGDVARASVRTERARLMLEAENLLIEYTFRKAMLTEMERRYNRLQSMQEVAETALKDGSITQLEYNKIELETLAAANEVKLAQVEMLAAADALTAMNGGRPLDMPTQFPQATLPSDFEAWLAGAAASSAELGAMRASLKQSESEITLRKREGLPDFSVGYQGKIINGGSQHGFGVSVSLPLWANRGRVKAAKALHAAEGLQLASAEEQFRLNKKTQYDKARLLENSCLELQKLYTRIGDSNEAYLKMALDKGTITTLEYLTVQEDYEAHYIKYIETRRDYLLARAALYAETL